MADKKVFLKKGREVAIEQGHHPWIFSGAIERFPEGFSSGDLAHIYSHEKKFLGIGYFHTENSLSGRVLSHEKKGIQEILEEKIAAAYAFREALFDFSKTNCFRLVNAEEDGLPGLIIDYYDGTFVLQIGTWGMEKLRDLLVDILVKRFSPRSVYEKSNSSARLQEGLAKQEGLLYGEEVSEITALENGIRFAISIVEGQKTGFFLDQREMRRKIGELSKGKTVLNCFSYSGGFSLYALKGGAKKVISVDSCPKATALARQNTVLNGFSLEQHEIVQEDVFAYLDRCDLSSIDLIILDPPAFAKKRQDVEPATRGYRQLAESVLKRAKKGSLLLACSCSYFIDAPLFQKILFQAAAPHQKEVQILSGHIHALDHPVSLYHPEGDYLKSFLLRISGK